MNNFFEYLKQNNVEEARLLFQNADQKTQSEIMSQIALLLQNKLNIEPQFISVIRRELKTDKTYDDFLQAWSPETVQHYQVPVQVVNAENLHNPKELVSIGLVQANLEEFGAEEARSGNSDAQRRQKVAEVTEKGSVAVYKVLGVYTLGK